MIKEYGGEFQLDYIGKNETVCKTGYIFNKNEYFTASGRHALMMAISLSPDYITTAVIPEFVCESVYRCFKDKSYNILTYSHSDSLQPCLEQIVRLTKDRKCIFLHMGYFGFETNAILYNHLQKLTDEGSYIIEDITHTLFNGKHLLLSHCKIASIRKWYGVISGGVIVTNFKVKGLTAEFKEFCLLREEAFALKGEYFLTGNIEIKNAYRKLFKDAENILNTSNNIYGIDKRSYDIICNADKKNIIQSRTLNYDFLYNNLPYNIGLRPVFNESKIYNCPFTFTVYAKSSNLRDFYIKSLATKNLYCPIHWPSFKEAAYYSDKYKFMEKHIFSIPCDQRYSIDDMRQIIKIIKDVGEIAPLSNNIS